MTEKNNTDQGSSEDQALRVTGQLLNRLVGLVSTIVVLGFLLALALIGTHFYFLVNPDHLQDAGTSADKTQAVLLGIWAAVAPVAQTALRVVTPVLLVMGGMILIAYLGRRGAAPFEFAKVTSDLPSLLALVIILTICLLPLAGLDVPAVLNNIALVVVGFYFGKRDTPSGAN